MILRPQMQKIDTWYQNGWLTRAFNKAMYYPTNPTRDLIFSNIWAPTKVWENDRSTGPTETWIWKNYGLSQQEIADAYWTQYGDNYFPIFYFDDNEFRADETNVRGDVIMGIRAQYLKNLLKYTKMIELAGFAYDPLRNVDAHEMYSVFENHGETRHDILNTTSSASSDTGTTEHSVQPYDTNDYKKEYKEENGTTRIGTGSDITPSATIGTTGVDQISSAGQSIDKASIFQSGANTTRDATFHEKAKNGINDTTYGTDYHVNAKDNAFGQELKGADYYKAEKHRRYGNIGVTKTQELLEAEREQLKFNLLQEFFDDINKVILIGVY